MHRRIFSAALVLGSFLNLCAFAEAASAFIPFDSRWDFPNYITWRPANEQAAALNPPRFSWPAYPPITLTPDSPKNSFSTLPAYSYILQLSSSPDFAPDPSLIEKRSDLNFENALPILAPGIWHWRVGYVSPDGKTETWSAVRSFSVAADTLAIDRSGIDHAVADLAKRPHPRLAPKDGDWTALRRRIEADPLTAPILKKVLATAEAALSKDWWTDFSKTDSSKSLRKKADRLKLNVALRDIGDTLSLIALAHQLTNDPRYLPVYDYALRVAKFPLGGETSPEFHGSTKKWGTQWVASLASIYDLGHEQYTPEQRAEFREGISRRIDAVFNEAHSWKTPDGLIEATGISGFTQSHPYENAMRASQAVLLMAGDLPVADKLTPLVLNYLLGVGSGHGPDGAWNEAGAYVFFKSAPMLDTALVAQKLLPQLRVAEYPWFEGVGDFIIQLAPPKLERQGFGDWTENMSGAVRRASFAGILQRVFALNHSPAARRSLEGLASTGFDIAVSDNPVSLLTAFDAAPSPAASSATNSKGAQRPASESYDEAGWFFASNRSPSDWDSADANSTVRLITIARPRGGYSHSYAHDGAFIWQAFGATLSAGGGKTAYGEVYPRSTFSHNGILVEGRGMSFRNMYSENPVSARPLYWGQAEKTNTVRWAADMTGAFLVDPDGEAKNSNVPFFREFPNERGFPGLQRWIRHYALINGRDVVMVDDLAVRPEQAPARFTWLYHVPKIVPVEHADANGLRARYVIDGVEATVRQYTDAPVNVTRLRGFETLKNPITGTDYQPQSTQTGLRHGRPLAEGSLSGEVVAVTSEPVRAMRFITVLTARPEQEAESTEVVMDKNAVTLTRDGKTAKVTIDGQDGPLNIPVLATQQYAEASDPYRLPATGAIETLTLSDDAKPERVEWLRRDTFADGAWVNRWWLETQGALVRPVAGKGLAISNDPGDPAKTVGTTLWMRADVPDRLAVRIRATNGAGSENNACNLNLILRARESADSPLVFGTRTGNYPELHKESNYIVTLVGGYKPGWSRIRRDPGFTQVAESGERSEPGQSYELLYLFDEGHLRVWINGKLVHDWTDAHPLPNGKLGFRTWHSDLQIHSVEIGKLHP